MSVIFSIISFFLILVLGSFYLTNPIMALRLLLVMNLFFKKFKSNCESFPDRIALSSYDGKNSYSYKQLWELTGKIYNYLTKKKIGKEDFVLVYMPRSIELYAALLGVWHSGAAVTIIESDNPI